MKPFLDKDFLLDSTTAQWLYHDVAAQQPIIDYHCHLPPDLIANNHRFANLAEIWLHGDHYKWRAMRACGVDERFCTGDAPDREKFEAWAAVVPKTLRNPLYHWTHLELRQPFGIENTLLGPDTAKAIWEACNAKLATDAFTTQGLLKQFRVEVVCTTDDPTDSLSYHAQYRASGQSATQLFPTWRPDRVLMLDDPPEWNTWIERLAEVSRTSIGSLDDLRAALKKRHDFFHEQGCRLSDHGLETAHGSAYTERELVAAFALARAGKVPSPEAIDQFRSAMLYEMALWDHARGWTQQFHFGAQRNNNHRAFTQIGRDTGYDSMGDLPIARPLQRFLDRLDGTNQLARTILYNLNPRDNQLLLTMMGNFQGGIPGKMQYGSGWWFLDQKHGMEQQLNDLSDLGVLSLFVGMLTDSRSFVSYSRHEYFRRILCNLIGDEVERGLLPSDRGLLSKLVEGVCYTNARDYFGFDRR